MDAMTEAHHDACKRKGSDPATHQIVARAAASFKDLANRFVRARTEGYACRRRVELKHDSAGRAFVAGQWGNFLGSIALFTNYLGGDEITEALCADFARLPSEPKFVFAARGARSSTCDSCEIRKIDSQTRSSGTNAPVRTSCFRLAGMLDNRKPQV
jgi:hypothetical protein